MAGIENVIDALTLARNNYKAGYRRAQEEYKNGQKDATKNYIGAMLVTQNQLLRDSFDREIERLKAEYRSLVTPEIEALRDDEVRLAGKVDTTMLNEIQALSNLPLSVLELNTLANKYAGKNYFVDKQLLQIAEQNGIDSSSIPMLSRVGASLDTRLSILEQLTEQSERMLSDFDGSADYHTAVLLSDSVLERAESLYTNGFSFEDTTTEGAKRALLSIASRDCGSYEKGIILRNILNNCNDNMRMEIVGLLAANTVSLPDVALSVAGIDGETKAVRNGDIKEFDKAKEVMKQLTDNPDMEFGAMQNVAIQNKDNVFFVNMVSRSKDERIRNAGKAADIMTKTKNYQNAGKNLLDVEDAETDADNNTVEDSASVAAES